MVAYYRQEFLACEEQGAPDHPLVFALRFLIRVNTRLSFKFNFRSLFLFLISNWHLDQLVTINNSILPFLLFIPNSALVLLSLRLGFLRSVSTCICIILIMQCGWQLLLNIQTWFWRCLLLNKLSIFILIHIRIILLVVVSNILQFCLLIVPLLLQVPFRLQ